jgi:hypothetical protein
MPNAKLGAKVDRYSFFVRLLPPLLHIGLARRTNIPISLKLPRSLRKGECREQAFLIEVTSLAACLVIALTAETTALP